MIRCSRIKYPRILTLESLPLLLRTYELSILKKDSKDILDNANEVEARLAFRDIQSKQLVFDKSFRKAISLVHWASVNYGTLPLVLYQLKSASVLDV